MSSLSEKVLSIIQEKKKNVYRSDDVVISFIEFFEKEFIPILDCELKKIRQEASENLKEPIV